MILWVCKATNKMIHIANSILDHCCQVLRQHVNSLNNWVQFLQHVHNYTRKSFSYVLKIIMTNKVASWTGLNQPNLAQPDNGLGLGYMKSGSGPGSDLSSSSRYNLSWILAGHSANLVQQKLIIISLIYIYIYIREP